jgi:hypothetical protein
MDSSPKLDNLVGQNNTAGAFPYAITSPPLTSKGILSPGFVRRSVRLTTPKHANLFGSGASPSPFKNNTGLFVSPSGFAAHPSATSPFKSFHQEIGETPLYPGVWLKSQGSRAQRPLLPMSTQETASAIEETQQTSSVESTTSSVKKASSLSNIESVFDFSAGLEPLYSSDSKQAAKMLKREHKQQKEKEKLVVAKTPRTSQSALSKRGEYRCGKCGFFPKKEKHPCNANPASEQSNVMTPYPCPSLESAPAEDGLTDFNLTGSTTSAPIRAEPSFLAV